jgi:heat shock protein HslJ
MLRSRHLATILGVIAVAIALAACGRGDDNANGGLGGTAWTVVSIGGQPTLVDARPTMVFEFDGALSGSSGCNQYSGRFRTDGDRISVGQLASTMMGCEADRMAQEQAFSAALGGATSWRQTETGSLELSGFTAIVAEPTAAQAPPEPEPSVSGPVGVWRLTDLGNTADFARLQPDIEFGADGGVAGFAGCNTFRGTYTIDGGQLALGPLATTRIGCQRPASAVEADYLAALERVTTWSIEGDDRLLLGGPVPLAYRRD